MVLLLSLTINIISFSALIYLKMFKFELLCVALSVHMGNCKSSCDEFMLHVKYGAVQSGSSGTGLKVLS